MSSPSGFELSRTASSSVLSSDLLRKGTTLESPKPKPTGLPILPEGGFPNPPNAPSAPKFEDADVGGVAKKLEATGPPVVVLLDIPLSLESEGANVKDEDEPLIPNGDGAKEGPDALVASACTDLENEKGSLLLSEPEVAGKVVEPEGKDKPSDLEAEDGRGAKVTGVAEDVVDEEGFGVDSLAGVEPAAGWDFPKLEENIVGAVAFCFVASEVSNSAFNASRCFLYVSKCVSDQSASGSSA